MKVFGACISVGIAAGIVATAWSSARPSGKMADVYIEELAGVADVPEVFSQEEYKEYMERALREFDENGGSFGDLEGMVESGDLDEGFLEEMDSEGGALRALKKNENDDDDDENDPNWQACPARPFFKSLPIRVSGFNKSCIAVGFSSFFLQGRFGPFTTSDLLKIRNECKFNFLRFPSFPLRDYGFMPYSMTNVKDADMEVEMKRLFDKPCFPRRVTASQIFLLQLARRNVAVARARAFAQLQASF